MKKWQIFKQGVLQELPLQLGVFPLELFMELWLLKVV